MSGAVILSCLNLTTNPHTGKEREMSEQIAAERIELYLDTLERMSGIDKEVLHWLEIEPGKSGVELRASDLRTVLAALKAKSPQRDA